MTNSTATILIVLLAFILVALVVLVMVLITRQTDPSHPSREDAIGEYVLDDLERFHAMTLATIQSVLNPYGEHDQTQPGTPNDTITVLNSELDDDEPDFAYDPTDILIPTTPDHQPTMLVPPGYDPVPHADNDEIALAARNHAHSQTRDLIDDDA